MTAPTRVKGNTTQRRAIAWLREHGWHVDKVEKTGRFQTQKDMFGLFDLVAIKPYYVLFVQVKTNQPALLRDLCKFSADYGCLVWCMTWYDYRGWVFHKWGSGVLTKIDMRKK